METAELTKTEQTHVERMSEPFREPSMQENFESWAERSISHSKKEKKENENNSGAREIKLAGRPDDEREWIEKVAQKDESEKKSPAKNSAEKDAAKPVEQHPNAKESEKPEAKAGEKPAASESTNSHVEPVADERYWQAKFGGQEDHDNHWNKVSSRIGVALAYIDQHKDKAQIEQGLRGLITDRSAAFQRDLYTALAEVPNPGEVLHHFALHSKNREVLRNAKTSQELRSYVQQVSKASLQASQASPKPRAPKPPSEVGGRGAATEDAWKGMNFNDFAARQSQTYAR